MNFRLIRHIAFIIIVAGMEGAYQYLNPSQFDWRLAIGAFLVASAAAAESYLGGKNIEAKIAPLQQLAHSHAQEHAAETALDKRETSIVSIPQAIQLPPDTPQK